MVDDHGAGRAMGAYPTGAVDHGPDVSGSVPDRPGITEEQLTEMALAADPGGPMDEDAVPLSVYLAYLGQTDGLLPQWYMPTPMARSAKGWRVPVVLVIVASFVIVEALGLCSTFGQLVPR